ncbi:SigB/SigF/SigG family RNA polymerase sigma factor [Kitasatospora sp. NPDC085879]|uniref:SigB/SigF/SigG family RNA polymerase sigma factor n=1 Tax=Kitasatospora sp. NPDC085879 TaxID=3154769 RepID=UPI003435FC79
MAVMSEGSTIAPGATAAGAESEGVAVPAAAPVRRLVEDPSAVAPADAKVLSSALFARLRRLEEGTAEYSYVRGTLVELNLSLVRYVARRFRQSGEPMDDIVQVGTVGLIKAIDRFDPDRGLEFVTLAVPTVLGEIKRFFRDATWAVHVPRRLQELRLALAKASDRLEQDLGRPATVAELAAHLEITEGDVVEGMIARNAHTAGSLDLGSDDDDGDGSLLRRLGRHDPGLEKVENLQALKPLVAALAERDRAILHMRFVDEMTQADIGARLGVSQMQVSRLLARILSRLREGMLGTEA